MIQVRLLPQGWHSVRVQLISDTCGLGFFIGAGQAGDGPLAICCQVGGGRQASWALLIAMLPRCRTGLAVGPAAVA